MKSITEAELLDALASAGPSSPEDARTVQELAAEFGHSVKQIREALRQLNHQRRLCVHMVIRRALDGRAAKVPAYTVTAAPKPRRK